MGSVAAVYAKVTMLLGLLGISFNGLLLFIVWLSSRNEKSTINIFVSLKAIVDMCGASGALMAAFVSLTFPKMFYSPAFSRRAS